MRLRKINHVLCLFIAMWTVSSPPLVVQVAAAKKQKHVAIDMSQMFQKWGTFVEIDSALDTLAKKMNEWLLNPPEAEYSSAVTLSKKKKKKPKLTEVMAKITTIGKSAEKRNLRILSLGKQTVKEKKGQSMDIERPEMMLMATMHGREHVTPHATLFVAWRLVEEYINGDPKVKALLDNGVVHFFPFLNPDGYEFTRLGKTDTAKLWRKNRRNLCSTSVKCAHGVDLNRNWGVEKVSWGFGATKATTEVYQGKRPFSEPELKAIGKWLKTYGRRINGFMDVHCCSAAILPPFYYKGESDEVINKEFQTCKNISKAMKAATPGIKYRAKRREKEWGESNTGIGVDWIYGEAGVRNVYIIETRGNNESHKIEEIFDMTEEQILQVGNELNAGFWALADEVINFDDLMSSEQPGSTESQYKQDETGDQEKNNLGGDGNAAKNDDGSTRNSPDIPIPSKEANVDLDMLMLEFDEAERGTASLRGTEAVEKPEDLQASRSNSEQATVESDSDDPLPTNDPDVTDESLDDILDTSQNDEEEPELKSNELSHEEIDDPKPFWGSLDDDMFSDSRIENEDESETENGNDSGDASAEDSDTLTDEQPSLDDDFALEEEPESETLGIESSGSNNMIDETESESDGEDEDSLDNQADKLLLENTIESYATNEFETDSNDDNKFETDNPDTTFDKSEWSKVEDETAMAELDREFDIAFESHENAKSGPDHDMSTGSELNNDEIELRFLGPDEDSGDNEESEEEDPFEDTQLDRDSFDSIESEIESNDRRMEKLKELFESRKSKRYKKHRDTFDAAETEADALLGPDIDDIERRRRVESQRRKELLDRYHIHSNPDRETGFPDAFTFISLCSVGLSLGVWRWKMKRRKHARQD
mmetsp:Transcript_17913/g.21928  ORF Transcript_17913/g.21928 Transcript_17913/m.21928 type:complete len:880 (+) Transcript_17913:338-2977(+)